MRATPARCRRGRITSNAFPHGVYGEAVPCIMHFQFCELNLRFWSLGSPLCLQAMWIRAGSHHIIIVLYTGYGVVFYASGRYLVHQSLPVQFHCRPAVQGLMGRNFGRVFSITVHCRLPHQLRDCNS